jgi:hypothetical protein
VSNKKIQEKNDFTEIEMVFKPITREGLMLYNGYTNDRKGDFISLAMREGHIEFQLQHLQD